MIDLLQKVLADPPVAPTGIPNLEATNNIFGFEKIRGAYQNLTFFNDIYPGSIFSDLTDRIITFLITISATIAVLMIVWAGIQYLTAYGNEDKTTQAKKTITWALIGLAIVALVYTILSVTASFINTI